MATGGGGQLPASVSSPHPGAAGRSGEAKGGCYAAVRSTQVGSSEAMMSQPNPTAPITPSPTRRRISLLALPGVVFAVGCVGWAGCAGPLGSVALAAVSVGSAVGA